MFKSSLLFVCICTIVFVGDVAAVDQFGASPVAPMNPTGMPGMPGGPGPGMPGMPGMPPQQRQGRPPVSEAVTAAQQEIETQLNTFLAAVNQGVEPNTADLAPIAAAVKKNMPLIQKMDTTGQAHLQLLNAWTSYFAGKLKPAKLAANAAYRADPQNKDAQTTCIIMAIANNDIKAAKTTVGLIRKKAAKSAAANQPDAPYPQYSQQSQAALEFDVNSIKTELLGEKIGAFDATCLNGTSLPFKGAKTLLALLWKNTDLGATDASSGTPAPMPMMMPGMPGMPGMGMQSGQTLTPLQAYGMLFAKEFQNSDVVFLGLNLDAEDQSKEVMATLMKNAWPWPQAMVQDARNAALASLASAHNAKPALAVVGPDGEIKYAGAISPLLLRAMARYAQGGSQISLAAPQDAKKSEDANTTAPPIAPTTETKEANVPPAPQPKAQKSAEETFNPQAQDLYNTAVQFMKMPGAMGMGRAVANCHQILKEYPDTPEAAKARLLLRNVPERKRAQYKITNEEMGL
jgi:hypothetical protein